MKNWMYFGAMAVCALLLYGCPNREAQREAAIQRELLSDATVPVTFVKPKIERVESGIEINGPLKTLDEVTVGSKLGGKLVFVSVQDGSPVRAGQTIAQVDASAIYAQLQQAQAGVVAAESALSQARIQARVTPEQSAAAVNQAEAALAQAKSRLELVRKGARDQEKAQARERVKSAESAMNKAKTDLDRAKRLYQQDAIAAAEVEAAQLQYDTAVANYRSAVEAYDMIVEGSRPEEIRVAEDAVRAAEEQLRAAKANAMLDAVAQERVRQAEANLRQAVAQLDIVKQQLADASIVSPIDGFVSGTPAKTGQVVSPGTPIAKIVGLNSVYFEGMIPEKEIARVKIGQSAIVRVDAFPNMEFEGTVIAIRPEAEELGRLFAARIAVSNGRGMLKPGMFAKASLTLSAQDDAVLIPRDAIKIEDGKEFVFVRDGDKAKRIEVTTGLSKDGWVQVFGLPPTSDVILGGKESVRDGDTIREDKTPEREA